MAADYQIEPERPTTDEQLADDQRRRDLMEWYLRQVLVDGCEDKTLEQNIARFLKYHWTIRGWVQEFCLTQKERKMLGILTPRGS